MQNKNSDMSGAFETQIENIKNVDLHKAIDYIKEHFFEDIPVKKLANAASLNYSSLTKLFKKELDVTPFEYLWRYRTEVAKRLLVLTELPIKEISKKCGFKTPSHFSRKFESYIGIAPTSYRKLYMNKGEDGLE